MLQITDSLLLVIDIQGNLANLVCDREHTFDNVRRLISGAQVLGLPVLVTEQRPDKLGPTIPAIADLLPNVPRLPKVSFSCWGEPTFVEALARHGRRQVLVTGIETHICVYQTARDLLANHYEVSVAADAVSSRTAENRALGLDRIKSLGGQLVSTEMALFELLGTSADPRFKQISALVK
jgi:nicotinamidase-related amidase